MITYMYYITYSVLTISSNLTNQDIVLDRVTCFISFSTLIGTRFFFQNAPFTFFGPGIYTVLVFVCVYSKGGEQIVKVGVMGGGSSDL